jgi:hypothetical protein
LNLGKRHYGANKRGLGEGEAINHKFREGFLMNPEGDVDTRKNNGGNDQKDN